MTAAAYPQSPAARTRWILERRGSRNSVSAGQAWGSFLEEERATDGSMARTATVFLTNRECPWKCLMCDLWRNTTARPVSPGAIPAQIRAALAGLPQASVLKLYNSGSFFDSGAVPASDWPEIGNLVARFDRLIVECHPRLVGPGAVKFARLLAPTLEVAMGLETCHPGALEALNKRISVDDYRLACAFLKENGMGVRTFLLVHPPFIPAAEQSAWLENSICTALQAGSDVVSLIPTRAGNGALDALSSAGEFSEPELDDLENAQEVGLRLVASFGSEQAHFLTSPARACTPRIFADTWDLKHFALCPVCLPLRAERIQRMNLSQTSEERVICPSCSTH